MYIGDPGKLELDKRSEPFSPIPSVSPKWGKAEDAFKSLKDGKYEKFLDDTKKGLRYLYRVLQPLRLCC